MRENPHFSHDLILFFLITLWVVIQLAIENTSLCQNHHEWHTQVQIAIRHAKQLTGSQPEILCLALAEK